MGFLNFNYSGDNSWIDYGFLVIAILYWGSHFYEKNNQYLTVDDASIKKNSIAGKNIYLSDINWIKKYNGDYILKTDTEELTINTEMVDEKSLIDLNQILSKLDLPAEKTPFLKNA